MLEWNVYVGDFNTQRIKTYNIFNHAAFRDYCKCAVRMAKSPDEFEDMIRHDLMYHFWSKCEWEVIMSGWPPSKRFHDKKIDVYNQVRLNWGAFIDYLWNHREDI